MCTFAPVLQTILCPKGAKCGFAWQDFYLFRCFFIQDERNYQEYSVA